MCASKKIHLFDEKPGHLSDDEDASVDETDAEKWVRMAEESKQNKRTKSLYRPFSHLCPTSIICKCLFSDAKHIMTADRRHMDPSTLEVQLIFKYDKDLWSAQTIDNIMDSNTSQ